MGLELGMGQGLAMRMSMAMWFKMLPYGLLDPVGHGRKWNIIGFSNTFHLIPIPLARLE